jgi:hypothetical protein
MGAPSDFIAEQFVPSEQYKAQQMTMAQKLIPAGLNPDQLETLFLVPVGQLSGAKPEGDRSKDR